MSTLKTVFDQVWVENRFRYRKKMTGGTMRKDVTGYLESPSRRGFKAKDKCLFIKRYWHCKNIRQICKSIPIDLQTVYDAVATDEKFRKDFIECRARPERSTQLNNSLRNVKIKEEAVVIQELAEKAKKYL